tara:strand:- start:90 stop:506 length:417 start_codon:yes stop_codon:yes gene_type:complete
MTCIPLNEDPIDYDIYSNVEFPRLCTVRVHAMTREEASTRIVCWFRHLLLVDLCIHRAVGNTHRRQINHMITTYFTPEQRDIYGDYLLSRRFMKGHMGRSEWDDIAARYPITLDEWFSSGVPALQELKAQMSIDVAGA